MLAWWCNGGCGGSVSSFGQRRGRVQLFQLELLLPEKRTHSFPFLFEKKNYTFPTSTRPRCPGARRVRRRPPCAAQSPGRKKKTVVNKTRNNNNAFRSKTLLPSPAGTPSRRRSRSRSGGAAWCRGSPGDDENKRTKIQSRITRKKCRFVIVSMNITISKILTGALRKTKAQHKRIKTND